MVSSNWEKYGVFVSILSLILGIVAVTSTAIIASQANNIAQTSLDLQNSLSNYTTNIIPNTDRIYLDGFFLNGTSPPIGASGSFNFSLYVFSPYLGTARVTFDNFTTVDYDSMLEPNTLVSFDNNSFLYNNPDQSVGSGLQKVPFNFPLSVFLSPNPNKLTYTSEPNIFAIGVISLHATFYNTDGVAVATKSFSQIIIVSIRTTT